MKNVVILGSTGTIGINALKVIDDLAPRYRVLALTAYNNFQLLEQQIKKFKPSWIAVSDAGYDYFKSGSSGIDKKHVLQVHRDLEALVSRKDVDIVVIGMRGGGALKPFLSAVRHGKVVAPANKEALVMAGDILMNEARKHGARIIPIDSEQSAIYQCLEGEERKALKKVYLTASGGPLYSVDSARFDKLSVEDVLNHPRWKMGKKITVDSATLMNKGFEVIEAKHLFDLSVDKIEIIIHREAIIHSMVEFCDGSVLAQLGITDMRLPIQYALTYPDRLPSSLPSIDFFKIGQLTFAKPDYRKFPSLKLALSVARAGGTLPSVLNAADEEVVEAFLEKRITFPKIYKIVEKVVRKHANKMNPDIDQILGADRWAREEVKQYIT